jgi:hypothetical protein
MTWNDISAAEDDISWAFDDSLCPRRACDTSQGDTATLGAIVLVG